MARTGLKYCDVPPLALRLAGLRAHRRLRSGSPDRCAASPPGNYAALRSAPGGGAKRLPGLQVHRRLPYRRPDRCAASPPGNYDALRSAPGGGASACPGYRSTAVCHTVARTDAQHHLREIMPHCALLPGAAQAPARATGPLPSAIPSPGQMRSIASGKLCRTALCSRGRRKRLPGLQVHRRLRTRRPGKGRNQISGVFLKPISISIGSCCEPAGSK